MSWLGRGQCTLHSLVLGGLLGGCSQDAATPANEPRPSEIAAKASTPVEAPHVAAPDASAVGSDASAAPSFAWSVLAVGPTTSYPLLHSWREGCPVALADLRVATTSYWDFDGKVAVGRLVMHADAVDDLERVLHDLFDAHFPIARMQLVDDYDGNDDASMAANNTSAFNCRRVAGTSRWSEHSYGRAIDINPIQNPQVQGSAVAPPAGRDYLDRASSKRGMVRPGDDAVRAFAEVHWTWGGDWRSPKDYQHFSASGR